MIELALAVLAFVFLRRKLSVTVTSGNGTVTNSNSSGGIGATVTGSGNATNTTTGSPSTGGGTTAFDNNGGAAQYSPENVARTLNSYPLDGYFLVKFVTRTGINSGGTQQSQFRTTSGVDDYLKLLAAPATNGNTNPALLDITFVNGAGEKSMRSSFPNLYGLQYV